jgi:uncharacterized protein YndB with AHSA1/START domain
MSKKNKVSSAKKAKTKTAAKPVKKNKTAAKPKNKAVKKTVVKKVVAKKVTKAKPVAKKAAAKKVIKSKPIAKKQTVKKQIIKKTAPKKVIKPVKKAVVKTVKNKVTTVKTKVKTVAKTKPVKVVQKTKPTPVVKPITKVKEAVKTEPKIKTLPKTEPKIVPTASNTKTIDTNKDVIAITNNIPKIVKDEISSSKINSISSSITNPLKTNDSYAVKSEKEPNGKYEMEFIVKSSADLLFEFLYTSSGLSEWFCDDVNIRNGIYTFVWDGQLQQARLLKTIENQLVRFQWVDKVDGSYFEFKIQKDELTNDISLIVTDFAENTQDANSSKLLWQSQVDKLLHVIGSIF